MNGRSKSEPENPEREFKMVGFTEHLYTCLREFTDAEGKTNRCAIREAVEQYLEGVEKLCAEAGFAAGEGGRKLVRTPIDSDIKETLDEAGKRSGLDATALLLLCLRNYLGMRLKDAGREDVLSRLERRAARSRKKAKVSE
jgi:predicted DNA-binding protein